VRFAQIFLGKNFRFYAVKIA